MPDFLKKKEEKPVGEVQDLRNINPGNFSLGDSFQPSS
jgi:hypothetical protein